MVRIVSGFGIDRAADVARAFTLYFNLVNLAEERHRIRVLRERGREGPVPDSLEETAARIRRRGEDAALKALIPELRVHLVLTAHPTEARRRSVIDGLDRVAVLLGRLDDGPTRLERAEIERRLLEEITILWRTDHLRRRRPDPLDEVRSVMAVFDQTLFVVVPRLYRSLEHALRRDGDRSPPAPVFLRLGSWVGADRDGNPALTADATRAAAAIGAEQSCAGWRRQPGGSPGR